MLEHLIELETSLHKKSVRNNHQLLEVLLHGDFFEFGTSGRIWSRRDTIESFSKDTQDIEIKAKNYQLHKHADEVAQLTYVSERPDGSKTLRSSLWKLDRGTWKMIFHQGTKAHS